ncbi:hemin uptake protein HemP [Roseovarius aestuarii]|nr:hemin uptake protein HemP [Roseovarius aestuarii]
MQPPQKLQPAMIEDLPTYDARQLTEGGDQARIVFDNKIYNLRITRAGKLILTK